MKGLFFFVVVVVFVVAQADTFKVSVNTDIDSATPFPHAWEESVGSGHAALGLRADWREALKKVHRDLGFKRVRFHGVFDDDMNVVLPTGVSFYNIDQVYDFLFSIGMQPLVELSFSPRSYATSNATIFHYNANISPPNLTSWSTLVSSFAQHLIDRYGLAVVQQLYFECWNEYNCGFLSATDPRQTYYSIFAATSAALKSVSSKLQVGGPVTCQSAEVGEFLSWAHQNQVVVDFATTHIYPTDPQVPQGNPVALMLQTLEEVRSSPFPNIPLFYTEFNDGLFSSPPLHDTPFASSYVVRLMSEVDGAVPLMSWWTFSDIFEEQGFPAQEFDKPTSTGWGLLSASGIPKPVYRAFQLLHLAGDLRLVANVAPAQTNVGVLALTSASLKNPTSLFVWNNYWPTTQSMMSDQNVSIALTGTTATTWNMTRIDNDNANAPAAWRKDGSPLYLNQSQIEKYKAASDLKWTTISCKLTGQTCLFPDLTIPAQGLIVLQSM